MNGVILALTDYLPCVGCADVRLVEQVRIAELTDDVHAAIADGSLFEPRCPVCHTPFPLGLSCLLVAPQVRFVVPDGEQADLEVAGVLLLALRQRRGVQPTAFAVVSRTALLERSGPPLERPIPAALWDFDPPSFPAPGPESRRTAFAGLIGLLDRPAARPATLRQLARAHVRRYQALGELDSLEAARVVAARAAVDSEPAERAAGLNICAAVAMLDYERVGDVEFLREAAAAYRAALDADPADALAAGGLGPALQMLADWDDDPVQRDAGVDALRRAVAAPGGDRAVRLNNLGSVLSSRAEHTGSQQDLTEAAIALAEAIELTPDGAPEAAARWNNLGTVRGRTHRQLGGAPMLDAAIDAFERAMAATAPADPAWPGRWANLADALWRRDAPGDRARSTELHREAAGADTVDPDGALIAAANWCRHAFQQERWEEATEAYQRALTISDVLLDRQLTGAARRARLRAVQWLPDLAAFAWARRGDALAAAGALEAGRARLLADDLELVAARVAAVAPELEARRARAVRAVQLAEHRLEDVTPAGREEAVDAVRRLRAELAAVTAAIGPSAPEPPAAMARLARGRPFVYVACTPAGSVASVVHGDPLVARLVDVPELREGEWDLATVGALAGRLAPLLAGHEAVTFSLPAALGHVALAAAPYGAGECLLDHHAIALLPAAAVAATGFAAAGPPRLGGVANPAREDVAGLAFAASELRAAAASLPAENGDLLLGARATVTDVLEAVGRCTHLHFACHGRFRPEAPLESALLLAGGELTVRRMQRAGRSADLRLLVLSACESAQTDADVLPDEMIGLPTAFLQVGARAVIGALWPVPDLPTNVLMARFYGELARHDHDAGQALRAAQNWVRRATSPQLAAFLTEQAADDPNGALLAAGARVLGKQYEPDELPFSSPSIWAAFVVFGTESTGESA